MMLHGSDNKFEERFPVIGVCFYALIAHIYDLVKVHCKKLQSFPTS